MVLSSGGGVIVVVASVCINVFEDSLYVLLGDSTTTIPTTIPTEARRIRNRP